jgi:XTP/dITP diphosphohydrolase
MNLLFVTHNAHKAREIQSIVPDNLHIQTLDDVGITTEIPETALTLEANAHMKMKFVADLLNVNCFADDTGLEIEALKGEPGVFSARYAGEQRSSTDNIAKVLNNLKQHTNRKARFRTVISLWWKGETYQFEGSVEGEIVTDEIGTEGFGYDPIFKPIGSTLTFAEMTLEQKNQWSHRARAMEKLIDFLFLEMKNT